MNWGFIQACTTLLDDFAEQNQLRVNLQIKGEEICLPAFLEAALFRIVQEALHNIAKHAKASTVWIDFNLEETGMINLVIRDDGVGFDPTILEQAAARGHIGLKQMRERVAGLKGTFELFSAVDQGTEIHISLPFTSTS